MKEEQIYKTNSLFNTVTYDKATSTWHFYFADRIYASSTGFWRLLKANKIKFVSLDNGHQFGLPKPIDLVDELLINLTGKLLTEIKVSKDTADLTLKLSEDYSIEIFISSSGFETYEFSINNARYIGLGSGDITTIKED